MASCVEVLSVSQVPLYTVGSACAIFMGGLCPRRFGGGRDSAVLGELSHWQEQERGTCIHLVSS